MLSPCVMITQASHWSLTHLRVRRETTHTCINQHELYECFTKSPKFYIYHDNGNSVSIIYASHCQVKLCRFVIVNCPAHTLCLRTQNLVVKTQGCHLREFRLTTPPFHFSNWHMTPESSCVFISIS